VGIAQQNSGLAASASAGFTASLPGASSASNTVVLIVAGSSTITTPTNWTLRTSQVNSMGHYWFERSGVSLTSIALTGGSASPETWWMFEVTAGVYQTATEQNNVASGTTYNTTAIVPTAGTKIMIASIASQAPSGSTARTVSGWTSSYTEQIDICQATGDGPMQGGAILPDFTADGVASFSTTTTYSGISIGRSALHGSYTTSSGGGGPALPRYPTMAPYRS